MSLWLKDSLSQDVFWVNNMVLELPGEEILQFQYILPVQGSLQTLELLQHILEKVKVDEIKDMITVDFDKDEINFMKNVICILDEKQQLYYQSLSLIHKILKETKNDG